MNELEYKITKKGIICKNSNTAKYIWGSKISITDLLANNLECLKNGEYLMTWKILEKRKRSLESKHQHIKNSLNIMNKIIKNKY